MLSHARTRARNRGLPFDLEPSDISIPTRCPVFDIPLKVGRGIHNKGSPTLDRIIPEKGYVKGNVIVVSWRANSLRNDATVEELLTLYRFYQGLLHPQ